MILDARAALARDQHSLDETLSRKTHDCTPHRGRRLSCAPTFLLLAHRNFLDAISASRRDSRAEARDNETDNETETFSSRAFTAFTFTKQKQGCLFVAELGGLGRLRRVRAARDKKARRPTRARERVGGPEGGKKVIEKPRVRVFARSLATPGCGCGSPRAAPRSERDARAQQVAARSWPVGIGRRLQPIRPPFCPQPWRRRRSAPAPRVASSAPNARSCASDHSHGAVVVAADALPSSTAALLQHGGDQRARASGSRRGRRPTQDKPSPPRAETSASASMADAVALCGRERVRRRRSRASAAALSSPCRPCPPPRRRPPHAFSPATSIAGAWLSTAQTAAAAAARPEPGQASHDHARVQRGEALEDSVRVCFSAAA